MQSRAERAAVDETGRRRDRSRPDPPEPLPAPVTDAHCHLDIADGDDSFDVSAAITAAAEVGVSRIVQVGCDVEGSRWAVDVAERRPSVVAAVALHPNEVPTLAAAGTLQDALTEIDRLAGASTRVRAVGETGLDHFRTGDDGWAVQEESFRAHLEIARRHEHAVMIHDRDAHADILRVLDDVDRSGGLPDRGVFHCFSGDAEMAAHCVERGWFLSFAGTVTFRNAAPLRNALAVAPLSQVLVETDAPFLTPHPFRGRPNASYLIPHIVETMAEVKNVDLGTMCEAIQTNTDRAFGRW